MARAREYFYWIDRQGSLFHDGSELVDARFLDFFFRRLKANDTGLHPDHEWVSPCGPELNFARCAVTPIVFRKLAAGRQLLYAGTLHVPFEPGALHVSEDGRLWHPAPVGERGLLGANITLRLGASIREEPGGYVLEWDGTEHVLG